MLFLCGGFRYLPQGIHTNQISKKYNILHPGSFEIIILLTCSNHRIRLRQRIYFFWFIAKGSSFYYLCNCFFASRFHRLKSFFSLRDHDKNRSLFSCALIFFFFFLLTEPTLFLQEQLAASLLLSIPEVKWTRTNIN